MTTRNHRKNISLLLLQLSLSLLYMKVGVYISMKHTHTHNTLYPNLLGSKSDSTLFNDRKLDSLTLGQGDLGGGTLTDNEHIAQTGSELVVSSVLNVDDIEGTRVALTVYDGTNTSLILSLSDHAHVSSSEGVMSGDLTGLDGHTDGVVNLHVRIRVTDGASVVGNKVRDFLLGNSNGSNSAQLVLSLLLVDAVQGETSLNVKQQSEQISTLLDGNNVHETSREARISADLSINLDVTV